MPNTGIRVLVTDDDADLRDLLLEAVTNWGYEADVARDGQEALAKLGGSRFDVVVCDLMMPGIDGITLLRRIKEADPSILVIIITGYATLETAVKAIEAGAYDYIAKPFRLDELMIVVKNASDRISLASENAALRAELDVAKAELEALRRAASAAVVAAAMPSGVDGMNPARQQEYAKEADRERVLKPNTTTLKV